MIAPVIGLPYFNCPHCGVLAQQVWSAAYIAELMPSEERVFQHYADHALQMSNIPHAIMGRLDQLNAQTRQAAALEGVHFGRCTACAARTIWIRGNLLFPVKSLAPLPSADLPEAAQKDYAEAAKVLPYSPRAAAALLRLSLEKLLGSLLGRQAKIDSMIADFVGLGVAPQIQQAMDILRVTGNEAVHPGTMDQVDDIETASALFALINLIVDTQITQPKLVQEMYDALPEGKRQGIDARNARALAAPTVPDEAV